MKATCLDCGKLFTLSKGNEDRQVFCSSYCRSKHWRKENKEKDLSSRRKYNEKRKLNTEGHKRDVECRRLWRQKNKDKKYSYKRAYRARRYGNGGRHTKVEWEEVKRKFNYTCQICGKAEPEVRMTEDHILPLSKGGDDSIENIQPLCKSCNSRKNDRV